MTISGIHSQPCCSPSVRVAFAACKPLKASKIRSCASGETGRKRSMRITPISLHSSMSGPKRRSGGQWCRCDDVLLNRFHADALRIQTGGECSSPRMAGRSNARAAFSAAVCYHLAIPEVIWDLAMWANLVKIVIHVFKKIRFEILTEMRRLAVAGIIASLLATAVIYSRDENVATEVTPQGSKQKFQQTKDREQAEGRFIPTPKVAEVPEDKGAEIASAFPLPRPRPDTPGFYYELVRAQGDAEEGEYVLIERKCVPNLDMPEPCYLPERGRQNFPLRRE